MRHGSGASVDVSAGVEEFKRLVGTLQHKVGRLKAKERIGENGLGSSLLDEEYIRRLRLFNGQGTGTGIEGRFRTWVFYFITCHTGRQGVRNEGQEDVGGP